jgi:hypothetical protein
MPQEKEECHAMPCEFISTPKLCCCALLFLSLVAAPASAQVIRGEIGAGAGVSTDQRGVKSSAITVSPGVVLAPDPRVNVAFSLTGTRFGVESQALGGALSLGARAPLGGNVALGASGSGSLTRTSFNASYGVAELTPTVEATFADVTVFGGAHAASGVTQLQDTAARSTITGLPTAAPRDVTVSRSSLGPVFGAMLNHAGSAPDESTALFYREEHARVQGVTAVDRSASASFTRGPVSFSVSGGLRDADDEHVTYGSIGAGVAVASSVMLQASAGQYPSSRVLGTPGGSYASVGVLLHAARRLSATEAPSVQLPGAPPVAPGTMRLTLRAPDARRVELAGDWNQWEPLSATRATDGVWYADVRLSPGEYRYAFKVDGQRWTVPDGTTSVDDGFGGRSAVVTIR